MHATFLLHLQTIPTYAEPIPELDEARECYLLQNFTLDFQRLIRRELEVFGILVDLLFDFDWRTSACVDLEREEYQLNDTREMEERICNSPVLHSFLIENEIDILNREELLAFLAPVKKHLERSWENYADIYSQDMYNFKYDTRKPLILTSEGKYLAHIWLLGWYLGTTDRSAGFIGIRSSWENTLARIYGGGIREVGYAVLTGCREVCKYLGLTEIGLDAPIGPMITIAEKYGFEGWSMQLRAEPLVPVPELTFEVI